MQVIFYLSFDRSSLVINLIWNNFTSQRQSASEFSLRLIESVN